MLSGYDAIGEQLEFGISVGPEVVVGVLYHTEHILANLLLRLVQQKPPASQAISHVSTRVGSHEHMGRVK